MKKNDIWDSVQDSTKLFLSIALLVAAPDAHLGIKIGTIVVGVLHRALKITEAIKSDRSFMDKVYKEGVRTFELSWEKLKSQTGKDTLLKAQSDIRERLTHSLGRDIFSDERIETEFEQIISDPKLYVELSVQRMDLQSLYKDFIHLYEEQALQTQHLQKYIDHQKLSELSKLADKYGKTLDEHEQKLERHDFQINEVSKFLSCVAQTPNLREDWKQNLRLFFVNEYNRKLTFDEFAMKDIYIQLFAYYLDSGRHIIKSEEWLINWITTHEHDDNFMLVSGDPACGKTTLLKKIGLELSTKETVPVFIRLSRFSFQEDGSIADQISRYCMDHYGGDPLKNLIRMPTIFLFDGLDEVALRGEKSNEQARSLVDSLYRTFHGRPNITVIIAGRKLSIKSSIALMKNGGKENVLTMMPLYKDPWELDSFKDATIFEDLRPKWWEKYGAIRNTDFSFAFDNISKSVANQESLESLSSEPFLLYLLAYSYEEGMLDFSQTLSINILYDHFIRKIYANSWNSGKRMLTAEITEEEYVHFLRAIGTISWHSGARCFSVSDVNKRLEATNHAYILRKLCSDGELFERSIFGLLLLFYFDSNDTMNSEQTFEFTHKSFGEYLAGVDICESLTRIFSTSNEPLDKLYANLVEEFGKQLITEEIFTFAMEQMKLENSANKAKIDAIRSNMVSQFPFIIDKKKKTTEFPFSNINEINKSIFNVEKNVFIFCSRLFSLSKEVLAFKPLSTTQIGDWLSEKNRFEGSIPEMVLQKDCSKDVCGFIFDPCIYFLGTNLREYSFYRCVFREISFDSAILDDVIIQQCEFENAHFLGYGYSSLTIRETTFRNCSFSSVYFVRSELQDVTFVSCSFKCVFIDSLMTNTHLLGNRDGIRLINTSIDHLDFTPQDGGRAVVILFENVEKANGMVGDAPLEQL